MSTPAAVSAMYQERLLAEYRAPKNRREMPEATARAEREDPLYGDAVSTNNKVSRGDAEFAEGSARTDPSASSASPRETLLLVVDVELR